MGAERSDAHAMTTACRVGIVFQHHQSESAALKADIVLLYV